MPKTAMAVGPLYDVQAAITVTLDSQVAQGQPGSSTSTKRLSLFELSFWTRLTVLLFFALAGTNATRCFAQGGPPEVAAQEQARQALNKGVQDFRDGKSQEAAEDFLRAKQLDPQLVSARLCLATTYASQYIPGAPSEENVRYGQIAIDEFRGVLEIDPQNLPAIDGIASILFQMGAEPFDISRFEEAKSYHRRHIQLRPGDPEPYFWIGVIDWTLAFRANGELRARFNQYVGAAGLSDADPLPPDLREQYAKENGATIDEGIDYLKRAIQWRPDYDDAMAYLNLLYRRKADTVVSNVEREELLKMADDLVDKVMEIKTNRSKQTDGTPTSNPDTR